MGDQLQGQSGFQIGDKIRIRTGVHVGARGVVQAEVRELLEIELNEGNIIYTVPEAITNYSLAARRVWRAMPKFDVRKR